MVYGGSPFADVAYSDVPLTGVAAPAPAAPPWESGYPWFNDDGDDDSEWWLSGRAKPVDADGSAPAPQAYEPDYAGCFDEDSEDDWFIGTWSAPVGTSTPALPGQPYEPDYHPFFDEDSEDADWLDVNPVTDSPVTLPQLYDLETHWFADDDPADEDWFVGAWGVAVGTGAAANPPQAYELGYPWFFDEEGDDSPPDFDSAPVADVPITVPQAYDLEYFWLIDEDADDDWHMAYDSLLPVNAPDPTQYYDIDWDWHEETDDLWQDDGCTQSQIPIARQAQEDWYWDVEDEDDSFGLYETLNYQWMDGVPVIPPVVVPPIADSGGGGGSYPGGGTRATGGRAYQVGLGTPRQAAPGEDEDELIVLLTVTHIFIKKQCCCNKT